MKCKSGFFKIVGLIFILAFFSACASTPPPAPTAPVATGPVGTTGVDLAPMRTTAIPDQDVSPPEWVNKGDGAFTDSSGGKAFHAVGIFEGGKNYALQRTAADDRARLGLAKVFGFYTKALTEDYMSHTTSGDFTAVSEEQVVDIVSKVITKQTLSGVRIIDHWEHPRRNIIFSLARIDLDAFKQNLAQHKELPREIVDGIKKRADAMHKKLEQEAGK